MKLHTPTTPIVLLSAVLGLSSFGEDAQRQPKPSSTQLSKLTSGAPQQRALRTFRHGAEALSAFNLRQSESFVRDGHWVAGDSPDASESIAMAETLKILSAFYKDVMKKPYSEGTDDPRGPLEEIQPKLLTRGLFLSYSTYQRQGAPFFSVELFEVSPELPSETARGLFKAANVEVPSSSTKVRTINSRLLGEGELQDTYYFGTPAGGYTILISQTLKSQLLDATAPRQSPEAGAKLRNTTSAIKDEIEASR